MWVSPSGRCQERTGIAQCENNLEFVEVTQGEALEESGGHSVTDRR